MEEHRAALAIVLAAATAELEAVPYAARLVAGAPSIARGTTAPFREDPADARERAAKDASSTTVAATKSATVAPATSTKPGPAAKPAGTSTSTKPNAKPEAADLRAKAGYAWKVKPFAIRKDGRVVASVTADGSLVWKIGKERVLAVFKPGGIVEDPDGKLVVVIGTRGDVWTAGDRAASGTLSARTLASAGGGTMSLDARGHLVVTDGAKRHVAASVVSAGAPVPLVLLTGWLAGGAFFLK